MARPKVLLAGNIPSPGPEILSEHCDVDAYSSDVPIGRDELVTRLKGKDALLCLLTSKIDGEVMDVEPRLRVVSSYSVGFDHIDVDAATKRKIYVCNTPGVLTDATADFAWALLMAAARRMAEADKHVRSGKWKIAWAPTYMLGWDVWQKTLGIVGLGRIGSAVARRARGFDMKLLYYDAVRAAPEVEKELGLQFTSLENLLNESDFVTIHAALTKETHHLINEERLRMMKPTAILVNDARGGIIDQKALARALKERWIAAAGIDVYEKEPIDQGDPLLQLDNVVLAPHLGSATITARSRMAEISAKNLVMVLKGEMPIALVNRDALRLRPLSEVRMI